MVEDRSGLLIRLKLNLKNRKYFLEDAEIFLYIDAHNITKTHITT